MFVWLTRSVIHTPSSSEICLDFFTYLSTRASPCHEDNGEDRVPVRAAGAHSKKANGDRLLQTENKMVIHILLL